jgi:hypothetical protein
MPNRQDLSNDPAAAAARQMLDAFYLECRVLTDAECAPLREAMRDRSAQPQLQPRRARVVRATRTAGGARTLGSGPQPQSSRHPHSTQPLTHQEIMMMNRPPFARSLAATGTSALMSVLCTGLTYFAIATLATEAHAGSPVGCPTIAATKDSATRTAPAAFAAADRQRARAEASAAAEARASALKPADDPEREHWRHHGVG